MLYSLDACVSETRLFHKMKCVITCLFLINTFSICSQNRTDVIRVRKAKEQKCSATLLGKPGGKISQNELLACHSIQVTGPCDYKVVSFIFSFASNGQLKEVICDSLVNWKMKTFLMNLKPNDAFFIENIKVKSNSSQRLIKFPALKFKIVK